MPALTGEHDIGCSHSDHLDLGGNILEREFAQLSIVAAELLGVGVAITTAARTLKVEGEYRDDRHGTTSIKTERCICEGFGIFKRPDQAAPTGGR
jgi:hypothetical protein